MIKKPESLVAVHTHTQSVSILQKISHMAEKTKHQKGVEIRMISIQNRENKVETKQCQSIRYKWKSKLVALLLVMCLSLSNSLPLLGSLVSIAISDDINQEIKINSEISKYIPYSYTEDDKGVILQQKIDLNIPEIENIKQSELTITIPEYSGIKPEKIELRTQSMLLTQDNTQNVYYEIDNENQQILIVQKSNTNETVYITYYYAKEAYDKYLETTHVNEYPDGELISVEKDQETGEVWAYIDFAWDPEENEGEMPDNKHLVDKLPISLKLKLDIISSEETISKEETKHIELDIGIKEIIDNTISSNVTEISKSNLYTKKEINYEIKNVLNIIRSDVLNTITIEDLGTHFISKNENINIAKIENNFISISKNNFEEILGQDGYIRFLNSKQEEIGKISSNMQADENGNYIFTYPEGTEIVNIELSDIKNDGFLIFNQNKTLHKQQEYSNQEMAEFKSLKTTSYLETTDINNYTHNIEQTVEISLLETYTSANLTINNENLSTIDENMGIEFKIELKNNNENTDLWANPFIVIEMPREVQDIKINGSNLLYGGGITLHSASVIDFNGHKAIKILMVGEQQDFISSSIVGGTTIIVNANITLKELTGTSQNNTLNMYYFNSNKTNYENSTKIELEKENYEVGYSRGYI